MGSNNSLPKPVINRVEDNGYLPGEGVRAEPTAEAIDQATLDRSRELAAEFSKKIGQVPPPDGLREHTKV